MKKITLQKHCIPCEGGDVVPMKLVQVKQELVNLVGWKLIKLAKPNKTIPALQKTWLFTNFKQSMKFVTAVAKIAETEGHHPDIMISYNRVEIILYTHAVSGVTENDIIVAGLINNL